MNTPVHGWGRGPSYGAPADLSHSVATGKTGGAAAAARIWRMLAAACWRVWAAIESRRATQRRRSLRVVETVGMGEKRFVAIVQVEEQRYLVGGGSAGVSLLAKLEEVPGFAAALDSQQQDVQSASRIREAW